MQKETLSIIGTAAIALTVGIMVVVESWWPFFPFFKSDKGKRFGHAATNGAFALCSTVMTRLLFIHVWKLVCETGAVHEFGLANWLGLPPVSHAIFVVGALDLWTYWWHRLNHMIPVLWRFHRVHHSDTTMDVSTSFRFHPGEIFFSSILRIPVLALLGARLEELILYEIMMMVVEIVHHSNFSVSSWWDARLRAVIASPVMHKLHHANDRHDSDSNYTALFSIWDRIFGSLKVTESPNDIRFGIMDFSHPHQLNFGFLLTMPFVSRHQAGDASLLGNNSFFSGNAEEYAKYRPSYPPKITQYMKKEFKLSSDHIVADIGSGTGLSSKLFLKFGCTVYGVEPDPAMRTIAEKKLAEFENFNSIDGIASDTHLPAHSVDFVVSAQAFQWFNRDLVKPEFKRILKPNGYCVMLWNQHSFKASAMAQEYDHLLHKFLPSLAQSTNKGPIDETLKGFFEQDFQSEHFKNYHVMNFETFLGWTKSYAFNLRPSAPGYNELMQELRKLYEKYNDNGQVTFEYLTHIYVGRFKDER